jgi:hypothetical protein
LGTRECANTKCPSQGWRERGKKKGFFAKKNLSPGWGLPNAATGALWEKTAEGKKKFKPG